MNFIKTYLICRGTSIDGGAPGYYSVLQTTDENLAIIVRDKLNALLAEDAIQDEYFEDRFADNLGGKNIKFGYEEGGRGKFYIVERDIVHNMSRDIVEKAIRKALMED